LIIEQKGRTMMNKRFILVSVIAISAMSLSACGHMTSREKSTATGAVVGGVAGSVLGGGSTMGAVGGAAVGGLIGNQIERNKK
jgi:osmotically inducible lipoprotein OsmB